jgi:hypothetical protein
MAALLVTCGPRWNKKVVHKRKCRLLGAEPVWKDAPGSRLRHQDAAELDGIQGLSIYNGLPESCEKQGRDRACELKRTCGFGGLRA